MKYKTNLTVFFIAISTPVFITVLTVMLIACAPEPVPKPEPTLKDQANLLVKLIEIDRILKERQARIDVLEKEKATDATRLKRCKMDLKLHDLCPNLERFFKKCADWNNEVRCICGNGCDDDRPCSYEMSEYYRQITEYDWRLK